MDDAIDLAKFGGVDRAGGRIPANFILILGSTADNGTHELAIGFEGFDECSADETGGTCDGDDHGVS